jgi:hypothetical protein
LAETQQGGFLKPASFQIPLCSFRLPSSLVAACLLLIAVCLLLPGSAIPLHAQSAPAAEISEKPLSPQDWAHAAVAHQMEIVNGDGHYMRFRQERKDEKGDQVKDVIETSEGLISRLVELNGQPLSKEAQAAESARLQSILNNSDELNKRRKRQQEQHDLEHNTIPQMPDAMLWSLAPGLSTPDTVVLDYKPNPDWHPAIGNPDAKALPCLAGRMWIDAHTQRMSRMQANVIHDCNYGWGILVHINQGGTMELDQKPVDPANTGHPHWEEARWEMHVTGTIMMLKHLSFNVVETESSFQPVPGSPTYLDAVHLLLK